MLRGLKYWIIGNILLELDFNSAVCNNQIQQCVNWLNAILWENLFRFDTPACGKWPSLFEFCFTKSLSCLHKVNIGTEVFGWELFCRDTCTYRKFKELVARLCAREIYFLSDECLFSFVSNSFLSSLKFLSFSTAIEEQY